MTTSRYKVECFDSIPYPPPPKSPSTTTTCANKEQGCVCLVGTLPCAAHLAKFSLRESPVRTTLDFCDKLFSPFYDFITDIDCSFDLP
jgi:hypothetical protein